MISKTSGIKWYQPVSNGSLKKTTRRITLSKRPGFLFDLIKPLGEYPTKRYQLRINVKKLKVAFKIEYILIKTIKIKPTVFLKGKKNEYLL